MVGNQPRQDKTDEVNHHHRQHHVLNRPDAACGAVVAFQGQARDRGLDDQPNQGRGKRRTELAERDRGA